MVKSLFPSFSKLTGKTKSNAPSASGKKTGAAVPRSNSGSRSHSGSTSVSSHTSSHSAHEAKAPAKAKSKAASAPKKSDLLTKRSLAEVLGETVCREVACEGLATSGGYCRLHYIKNWKKIKRKEVILREKKLNQYIEELVAKYPEKYIEAIRQDLASDKDFAKVIYDLDLDEAVDDFDAEASESVDSLIDTIKRDFEDEGDAF